MSVVESIIRDLTLDVPGNVDDWADVEDRKRDLHWLYDTDADPGETTDVASENPDVVTSLARELRLKIEEVAEVVTGGLDDGHGIEHSGVGVPAVNRRPIVIRSPDPRPILPHPAAALRLVAVA